MCSVETHAGCHAWPSILQLSGCVEALLIGCIEHSYDVFERNIAHDVVYRIEHSLVVLERGPARALRDVIDGYVSLENAREEYGVVIDMETMTIDNQATEKLRKGMKENCKGG